MTVDHTIREQAVAALFALMEEYKRVAGSAFVAGQDEKARALRRDWDQIAMMRGKLMSMEVL